MGNSGKRAQRCVQGAQLAPFPMAGGDSGLAARPRQLMGAGLGLATALATAVTSTAVAAPRSAFAASVTPSAGAPTAPAAAATPASPVTSGGMAAAVLVAEGPQLPRPPPLPPPTFAAVPTCAWAPVWTGPIRPASVTRAPAVPSTLRPCSAAAPARTAAHCRRRVPSARPPCSMVPSAIASPPGCGARRC